MPGSQTSASMAAIRSRQRSQLQRGDWSTRGSDLTFSVCARLARCPNDLADAGVVQARVVPDLLQGVTPAGVCCRYGPVSIRVLLGVFSQWSRNSPRLGLGNLTKVPVLWNHALQRLHEGIGSTAILNAGRRPGQTGAEIGTETTSGTPVSGGGVLSATDESVGIGWGKRTSNAPVPAVSGDDSRRRCSGLSGQPGESGLISRYPAPGARAFRS